MKTPLIYSLLLMFGLGLLQACSSNPAGPDYRYDEQKRSAKQNQDELTREVNR